MARTILFLSDYGLADEFVGVCHAVIARSSPDARVIDLSHGVPRGDVLAGALALSGAVPYAPENVVWLAVVDPGVGTARRPIAVAAGKALLVGPDNGLLSLAWEAIGGARSAVAIDPDRVASPSISRTFHGRDVFAPAAARLAGGTALEDLGPPVAVADLIVLRVPQPDVGPGRVEARVIGVDRFGNVRLAAVPGDLERAALGDVLEARAGRRAIRARRAGTFGEVPAGEHAVVVDSAGWVAVVRNAGSAAASLDVAGGELVLLSSAGWDSAS